jgi:hypothetical protein
MFFGVSETIISNLQRSEPGNNENNNIPHLQRIIPSGVPAGPQWVFNFLRSTSEQCYLIGGPFFQIYNVQNLEITRITTFHICNVVYQAGYQRDPMWFFLFFLRFLKEHFINLIT